MGLYKNFKTVVYCVASGTQKITETELTEQIEFFQKYIGVDKVYLETFRGEYVTREQLELSKRKFKEHNIEVSGGITTVTPDLNQDDIKRQRLFGTFCYSNEPMREHLKKVVEYTAEQFDEFIIDDFYFTQCMCEDCQHEKGKRSWEEFRLSKMLEVSENLIIKPAKNINPKINIIIKYPNWAESYQETGYNPEQQKDIFDMIYTGTETRNPVHQDQHLPRYLSYSLMRYMENTAPSRNGGGWFDPYECYPMEAYLEQCYLTAFSRPKELMFFCWGSLYKNKVVTPVGLQLNVLDDILSEVGNPVGLPVYIPHNAQGEDHLEDYLGMMGIPFEPTPDFPEAKESLFLTSSALQDKDIIKKLKAFVNKGGKAIVTSGFMKKALGADTRESGYGITDMTSIRDNGRSISVNEFNVGSMVNYDMNFVTSGTKVTFPVLEHRNNASWSLLNAGVGDHHASIMLRDTFGKGQLITLVVPDLYSMLKELPQTVLTKMRFELKGNSDIFIDAPAQISLFTYDNDTFGIYSYTSDKCKPARVQVHISGNIEELQEIPAGKELKPYYCTADETVFEIKTIPGSFYFYKLIK